MTRKERQRSVRAGREAFICCVDGASDNTIDHEEFDAIAELPRELHAAAMAEFWRMRDVTLRRLMRALHRS